VVLVAAGAALAAYSLRPDPLHVTAITLKRGHVEETVTAIASGTVKPNIDATIASECMGKVINIHAREGQRVKKGDLLVELSHEELDAQVALAEANYRAGEAHCEQTKLAAKISDEVAKSHVNQTEAQRSKAKSDYQRLKALADKSLIPQMDLDKAALALRVAEESESSAVASARESEVRKEQIRSAEAALDQLKASVDVAKAQQAKAFVRAPFDGVVAKVFVDMGEAVSIGVPIVELVDDSSCYVEAPFDEANAAELKVGQRARINVDAHRGVDFKGHVEFIPPVVSINKDLSRTLNVRIRVDEHQDAFVSGMSADVIVLVDQKDDVLYVPTQALVREKYAFVIKDGTAVERKVTPGIGNWNTREITDGLHEGETLITSVGLQKLHDGVPVQVVDELESP